MTELIFVVEEDVSGGYSVRALGEDIFTQGETPEEIAENVRDAVRCHFFDRPDDAPKIIRLHYVRDQVLTP